MLYVSKESPEDRPITSTVVSMFVIERAVLLQPKQPGFFKERSSYNADTALINEVSHWENLIDCNYAGS